MVKVRNAVEKLPAEIYNRLSRVHQRYRQTDGRLHIANVTMSSRSLKTSEASVRLSVSRSQRALTLYPAIDCAAATDISGVSGRWQLMR